MTQILDSHHSSIPARRRVDPAVPILIRVPALTGASKDSSRPLPRRRRRLRREVRVAGYLLLALIPFAVAGITWGSRRPALLLALAAPTQPAAAPGRVEGNPTRLISLSLEPEVAPLATPEWTGGPVVLSGQLLPADAAEESSHGGY